MAIRGLRARWHCWRTFGVLGQHAPCETRSRGNTERKKPGEKQVLSNCDPCNGARHRGIWCCLMPYRTKVVCQSVGVCAYMLRSLGRQAGGGIGIGTAASRVPEGRRPRIQVDAGRQNLAERIRCRLASAKK